MRPRPEVSVVIPTFNRPEYLREAIRSAISQTVSCEVLVVAHGPTPETLRVLDEFQGKIVPVLLEKDFGPHFSWLHGLLETSGQFIKILFDDDLMDQEFVEKALPLMTESVGFVFSLARLIDAQGSVIPDSEMFRGMVRRGGAAKISGRLRLAERNLISPSATLVRRSDAIDAIFQGSLPFQRYSYFGVGPDHFLKLICLLRYKKIGYIDEPLVSFRAHPQSISIASQEDPDSRRRFRLAYLEPYLHFRLLRAGRPFLEVLRVSEYLRYQWRGFARKVVRDWLGL